MKTNYFLVLFSVLIGVEMLSQSERNIQIYQKLMLSRTLVSEDQKKARRIMDSVAVVLDKKPIDTLWGLYYRNFAHLLSNQQLKDEALDNLDKSIKYFESARYPKGVVLSMMNKGNIYLFKGDSEKALVTYLDALKIAERQQLKYEEGLLNKNIGVFFDKLGKYDQSIEYAERSLEIFKQIGSKKDIMMTSMNIANGYYGKNDYGKALSIYEEVFTLAEKLGDSTTIAQLYNNIAGVLIDGKNEQQKGIEYLLKSLSIKEKLGNLNDIIFQYNNLAIAYLESKDFTSAEKFANKAIVLAEKHDNLLELKEAYLTMSDIYSQKVDFKKALDYHKLHQATNDKLLNVENQNAIQEMTTKYQTAEKDNQILLQNSKLLKRNTIIALLAVILLIGYVYYRLYKNKQKLRHQKAILKEQDNTVKAVINTEDRERKRMATHLHDGIGQSLSALNMNISVLEEYRENRGRFEEILQKTKILLSDAITDVRTLSHTIMPNMLIKHSLSDALRELIEKSNSPSLQISLDIIGLDNNINSNVQLVLYRVIQECIQNTIKHANASKVSISVIQENNNVKVSIQDNGVGFNPLEVKLETEGMGFVNIKSRLDFLKGKIIVESSEGKGTVINISIPLS